MNTIAIAFLVCVVTVHCATYKTFDGKLSRVARSPHFPTSTPPPGDSPVLFRTQNWSGVARGPNGASGVFSGAAAEAGSPGPVPSEAVALAAAGASPVKDKLEERFGEPHFHDHRHPYFSRGFNGFQPGGNFHYGSWGSNRQAFGKSQSFSNAGAGCDDDSHNGFIGGQQSDTVPVSVFQANSNGEVGYAGRKQNGFADGQHSSNNFNKVESSSFASSQSQGADNSAANGGRYQSNVLNGKLQDSAASKLSVPSQSHDTDGQQVWSSSNGIGQSRGSLNVESNGKSQSVQNGDGQQFESHSTGFGSSQGLQNDTSQQAQTQGSSFGGAQSQSGFNGFGQYHGSLNSESNGRSQNGQNGGGQQFESHSTGFGSSQGLQNDATQQAQTQGSGFTGAQSQSGPNGFGQYHGSLNSESKGRSQSGQNGGSQQFESHGTSFGSSQSLQNYGSQQAQAQGSCYGGAQPHSGFNNFGQSYGSLNAGSNSGQSGQSGDGPQFESLGTEFGSSQDLQNDGSQQVQSLGKGLDSAQSQSEFNGQSQDRGSNFDFQGSNGNNGFRNSNTQSYFNRRGSSGSSFLNGGNSGNFAYGKGGSAKYQAETQTQEAKEKNFSSQALGSDHSLANQGNVQGSLSSGSDTSGREDIQSTLNGALNLVSQGLEASQKSPCTTCQKGSYAFSNARSNSGSAIALSIGG